MRVESSDILSREILSRATKALLNWRDRPWTVMGFGMIRTYLDDAKEWRLNVWDDNLRTPGVSDIHTHPWHFTSWVMCGAIVNQRYKEMDHLTLGTRERLKVDDVLCMHKLIIETGEGGGPVSDVEKVFLLPWAPERILPGGLYSQVATDIHRTEAMQGTVTLNRRSPPMEAHTAAVYWENGDWVSAEPRPASHTDVLNAVRHAARRTEELTVG